MSRGRRIGRHPTTADDERRRDWWVWSSSRTAEPLVEGLRDIVAQFGGDGRPGRPGRRHGGRPARDERTADRGGDPVGPRRRRRRGRSSCSTSAARRSASSSPSSSSNRPNGRSGPRQRGAARRGGVPRRPSRPASARRSTRLPRRPRGAAIAAQVPRAERWPSCRSPSSIPPGCTPDRPPKFVQVASRFQSRIVDPQRRPRGRRQEPHRPARSDDPARDRDHPRRPTAPTPTTPSRRSSTELGTAVAPARRRRHPRRTPGPLTEGGSRRCRPRPSPRSYRRGDRHRHPRVHRRGLGPADGLPDRQEPVRQRRAVDDLVRLRVRDLRRRLLGRPHQRLPHQPGRHDRPVGDAQDRQPDGRSATSSPSSSARSSAPALTYIILSGNDPKTLGLGRGQRQRQRRQPRSASWPR